MVANMSRIRVALPPSGAGFNAATGLEFIALDSDISMAFGKSIIACAVDGGKSVCEVSEETARIQFEAAFQSAGMRSARMMNDCPPTRLVISAMTAKPMRSYNALAGLFARTLSAMAG